jgi:hypothetical protein
MARRHERRAHVEILHRAVDRQREDATHSRDLQPRKTVGKLRDPDPLRRLERLNKFTASIRPRTAARIERRDDGTRPVRKRVGRPEPR